MFLFKGACKILIEEIKIEIAQMRLFYQLERLFLFLEQSENIGHYLNVVLSAAGIDAAGKDEFTRIVLEIIDDDVFLASEVAVEGRPSHPCFSHDVGDGDLFVLIFVHQLEKRRYDVVPRVVFGRRSCVLHETNSPRMFHLRRQNGCLCLIARSDDCSFPPLIV